MERIGQIIPRRSEHERLVSFLTDERFFLPVALTTSLPGAYGFGKTTLARAVFTDPRIQRVFSDGIYRIRLGGGLSAVELTSRIAALLRQMTGEEPIFNSLEDAEMRLHEVLHPRRTLLVVDEVDDADTLNMLLKSGPGGACLLITHNDACLPISARRVPVDVMMAGESLRLLLDGFVQEEAAPRAGAAGAGTAAAGAAEARPAVAKAEEPLEEDPFAQVPASSVPGGTVLASMRGLAAVPEDEAGPRLAVDPAVAKSAQAIAARLNDWPMLLALVNGMLKLASGRVPGRAAGPEPAPLTAQMLRQVQAALDEAGLPREWAVQKELDRKRALAAVMVTCLSPLSAEQRERAVALAVFPTEESIALGALEVLWDLPARQVWDFCVELAHRRLVEMDTGERWIRINAALHECLRDQLWAGGLLELNRRLVDRYAQHCPDGWPSGPDDGYYFQHLAAHLDAAGRREVLQDLLFDYQWLGNFLACKPFPGARAGDLYALLADYERALATSLDQQSAQLRLVQDALRLSAPVITRDATQLAPQLIGRLLPFDEPRIREMIRQAHEGQGRSWLRPLAGCFTPPGSEALRSLPGHSDWVTAVALLPDGQRVLSGSLDGALRLWDLGSGQMLGELTVALPAGQVLADIESGSMHNPAAHEGGVSAVRLTPDGLYAASAGWDGYLRIWNLAGEGSELRAIRAHVEPVGALAITPDGKRAITGADDRMIRVWNLETGAMEMELVGHGDLVRVLAVTPDGRTLVSGSWDATLRLWDLETGKIMHILTGHTGWVRSLAVSPDGYSAVSGAWDRTLRVWDLWTGDCTRVVEGFSAPVYSLAFSPDGSLLLAGGGDGSISLWNFASMERGQSLNGHGGGVNDLSISPSGRFVVSGSDDRSVRVWDLVALQNVLPRVGHDGPVPAVTALPDGLHAISGSLDGTLKVWEPAAGKEIRTLAGHAGGVSALAVTADGAVAISGSHDCTVRLWDLPGGKEIRALAGHEQAVSAVAITPDGRVAASGDEGGVVRAWDTNTGACLASFRGEEAISACAISADGRVIAASQASGKMYFLEIRIE